MRRYRMDWGGAYAFVCYGALLIALVLALGVFAYGRILTAELNSKNATLAKAQSGIDEQTVESFLRLHDRLSESQALINSHLALSNALTLFGNLLPATVRLTSGDFLVDSTNGMPSVAGNGVAKDFNSLASASAAFGANQYIQNAIFSRLAVNKDNSVSFALTATLDPKLLAYSVSAPGAAPSSPPAAASSTLNALSTQSAPHAPSTPVASSTKP